MEVWVIYSKKTLENPYGNNAFTWMIEAAENYGMKAEIVFVEDLWIKLDRLESKNMLPKVAIMRCYEYVVSTYLEAQGVLVLNNTASMMRSKNKAISHLLLSQAQLPMPCTYYGYEQWSYENLIAKFHSTRFIAKGLLGSQGQDVFLIQNEAMLKEVQSKYKEGLLYQQYIETSYGRDIRVYVVGNQVVGSVLRFSQNDFRSNYALGGSVEAYPIEESLQRICIKATQALGLVYAGIDVLFGPDGPLICEVNGNAAFRTLSKVTNVSIPHELFRYIKNCL